MKQNTLNRRSFLIPSGDSFAVTVNCEKLALWTWVSLPGTNAKYSDNFVHVMPETAVQIAVQPAHPMSKAEFTAAVQVQSLCDTHSHASTQS